MNFYGSDKPDLRIESRISDVTEIVSGDRSSKLVQKIFHGNAAVTGDDIRVKCIKFDANTLKQIPTMSYLNNEVPEIVNK